MLALNSPVAVPPLLYCKPVVIKLMMTMVK